MNLIKATTLLVCLSGCQSILGFDDVILDPQAGAGGAGGAGAGGGAGGQPVGGSGGAGGQGQAALTLQLEPASLRIQRGKAADVAVTLVRRAINVAVTIELSGLPTGVTATPSPLVVAAGETSGTISLSAAGNAAVGAATVSFADQGALANAVDLSLMIADAPGTLDTSFDQDGILVLRPPGGDNTAKGRSLVEQSDGALVVGATLDNASGWVVLRFSAAGVADTTFNTNAAAVMPSDGQLYDVGYNATTGHIVVTGVSGVQLTVLRLNGNGTADQSFDGDGKVSLSPVTFPQGSEGHAVMSQADSKVVVVGTELTPSPSGLRGLTVRFGSNGALESAFVKKDISGTRYEDALLEPGGKIVAAGRDSTQGGGPLFRVARYNADGSADTSFATTGQVSFGNSPLYGHGVAREPQGGGFVVCGEDIGGSGGGMLGRLSAAGAAVWSTPGGSRTYTPFGNGDKFYGCAVQNNNRIIAVGNGRGSESHEAYVLRFDSAGDADPSFGTAGAATFPSNAFGRHYLYDVIVLRDGRIMAVGNKDDAGLFMTRLWD